MAKASLRKLGRETVCPIFVILVVLIMRTYILKCMHVRCSASCRSTCHRTVLKLFVIRYVCYSFDWPRIDVCNVQLTRA